MKVVLVLLFLIAATTILHFQALRTLTGLLSRMVDRRNAFALVMIISLLVVHLAEVVLFAVGYGWSVHWAGIGALEGEVSWGWQDYVYFSGTVYTTLGFGDIIPRGPLRLMAGLESLMGLLMIAWSGSFTFLQMQRFWDRRN